MLYYFKKPISEREFMFSKLFIYIYILGFSLFLLLLIGIDVISCNDELAKKYGEYNCNPTKNLIAYTINFLQIFIMLFFVWGEKFKNKYFRLASLIVLIICFFEPITLSYYKIISNLNTNGFLPFKIIFISKFFISFYFLTLIIRR